MQDKQTFSIDPPMVLPLRTLLRASFVFFLLQAIVVATGAARGDDLSPAIFREHAGARMDHWEYTQPESHSNEENWAPEHSTGIPPGNMKKPESTTRTFWEQTYAGRPGVWRVDAADGAFLDFTIPNVMDPRRPKAVIVQVTWWPTSNEIPVVDVVDGNTNNDFAVPDDFPPETTALDDGWKHTRYHFWSDTCPSFELVRIQPPPNGVLYVDQVVVDAVCIAPFGQGGDDDPEDNEGPGDESPNGGGDGPGGIEASDDKLGLFGPFGLGIIAGLLLALLIVVLLRARKAAN